MDGMITGRDFHFLIQLFDADGNNAMRDPRFFTCVCNGPRGIHVIVLDLAALIRTFIDERSSLQGTFKRGS